jgi:hypothetical protein
MIIGISGKIGSGKDLMGKIIQYLCWDINNSETFEKFLQIYSDINKLTHQQIAAKTLSGWEIKKFTDKLKDIVCLLIGCTKEQLEDETFKNTELGEEWCYYKNNEFNKIISISEWQSLSDNKKEYFDLIKLTPRLLLQLLGTEYGRNIIHPNVWVNSLFTNIDRELNLINNNDVNIYKSDYIYSEPTFIKKLEGNYNLYQCCCGSEFKADKYKIKTKHTKSCGCYQKYKAGLTQFKDGRKGTRLWSIYNNMIQRCENVNHPRYKDYGGRNITVSEEFKPFENFKKWALVNGYNDKLSIDRIGNNDIYCPDNCKFSSDSEQAINTRDRKDNNSGYRGVSKDKHNWNARIQINGKQKFLGYFDTAEEASIVYEKAFVERAILYNKKIINRGFIITDLRYPNEYQAIKDRKGITIRVNRGKPQLYEQMDGDIENPIPTSVFKEHESETQLDNAKFDYVIDNNSDIQSLIEKVKIILKKEKII